MSWGQSLGHGRFGRVALATCAALPAGDEDAAALGEALRALGVEAEPAVWDAADVDWRAFDLVVVRSAWDYAERRDAFLAWAASVPRICNPLPALAWSADKERYLPELAAAGVPIVPSRFLRPGEPVELPAAPFVVKPAVSAGGRSSARFDGGAEHADAAALVARLHAEGRTAIVQPDLGCAGEIALVYLGGAYSHALRRRVRLPGADAAPARLYLDEELAPGEPTPAQRAIADAAVARAPTELLYARVDLLGDAVLELEAVEPSLYLAFGERAAERLATAIRGVLERAQSGVPCAP